jgi:hypothetical protein
MKNQLKKITLIAGLAAASVFTIQAQPYYATGAFQGWTPGANLMNGGPAVYDYTITGGTAGTYHELKVTGATWGDPNWPGAGKNLKIKYDAGGSNSIYFYPGAIIDGWLPVGNRIGFADPGNMSWELAGAFNGWSGGAGYELNSVGNGVYSNSIVIATAGTYEFKFRSLGAWDVANGVDFGHDGANASITTTNSPQTVPFVYDLPNGRFLVGNLVPPPVTNQVVFLVDMSVQTHHAKFDPATDAVCVSGAFNGWPGTATNALFLTNVPAWGGNTNIYYATNTFTGTPSSLASAYKFVDTNPSQSSTSGYEPRAQNRSFNLLPTNGVLVLPVVYFADALTNDYLAVDTLVTFRVDMNGAQTGIPAITNPPVPFNPGPDPVFINGNFLTNGWIGTWNPIALENNAMTDSGGLIYTFTYLVPKGNLVRVQYKYGFDNGIVQIDNEAPSDQDHVRYIRTSATGTYVMPIDTYGNQYNEPDFGQLSAGPASGGTVPVTWLGRPGVRLQSSSNLAGGLWTDHYQTDGTNWSVGASSTNGLVSGTNWPSSGNQFFRLIKQ